MGGSWLSYTWEALTLVQTGAPWWAVGYVVGSNAAGLIGVWLGAWLG